MSWRVEALALRCPCPVLVSVTTVCYYVCSVPVCPCMFPCHCVSMGVRGCAGNANGGVRETAEKSRDSAQCEES